MAILLLTLSLLLMPVQAAPTQATPADTLRVLTYNIKHGLGMDGQVDLARSAAVIRRLDPDVVLLQEVDSSTTRTGGVAQARRLSKQTGLAHYAFGALHALPRRSLWHGPALAPAAR